MTLLKVIDGDGMTTDEAAWAMMADAAEAALRLPGLSGPCAAHLDRAWKASRRAAGLPARQRRDADS